MDTDFLYQIYAIVEEIPYGKVATYGQIAILSGYERRARMVGKALSHAGLFGEYPCHRVVSSTGRTAPCFKEQKMLLQEEGVTFRNNGNVDMQKHLWKTE